MELRDYQQAAYDAVLKEWDAGHRRTLLVLPTGCGKTVVFSAIANHEAGRGRRVLILAHRGELLEQARETIRKMYGLECGLEKADSTGMNTEYVIILGSIQTLSREDRLTLFPHDFFGTIIVDEAHHSMSPGYQRVLEWFPEAHVLGVTATPDRGDHQELSDWYDSKAYEYSLTDAVKQGYLCPVRAQLIPLQLDLRNVHIRGGDFREEELGNALDPYLESIAGQMVSYCKGRKTVVFLPLVRTAKRLCELLQAMGMKAEEINGESGEREAILERFRNGETQVLCNSMLLTEGWDCPAVDCVVVLRPTQVRALYQQMIGRGMRLSPSKDHLLLLDFLWLTSKHNLCRPCDLEARNEDIANRLAEKMHADPGGIDLLQARDQAERDAQAEREASIIRALKKTGNRKAVLVDPLKYVRVCGNSELADYEPVFRWEYAAPTQKQLDLLKVKGIDVSLINTRGFASAIIDQIMEAARKGLATPKQIQCLEGFGYTGVSEWTKAQASSTLARLLGKTWDLPQDSFNKQ